MVSLKATIEQKYFEIKYLSKLKTEVEILRKSSESVLPTVTAVCVIGRVFEFDSWLPVHFLSPANELH